MSIILSIDPGPEQSAWLTYDAEARRPCEFEIVPNPVLLRFLITLPPTEVSIEMVASFGMAVGKSVFETVYWVGRFAQAAIYAGSTVRRIYRADIKVHLCHARNAKDTNVRQAIIDRYGDSKESAIGTKNAPGPLYGVSKHVWSALAVAITAAEVPA